MNARSGLDGLEAAVIESLDRNPSALAMDLLFLFTLAFFTNQFVSGWWPAAIATPPLIAMLYFGWRSSKPFFLVQLLVIALTIPASLLGWLPI